MFACESPVRACDARPPAASPEAFAEELALCRRELAAAQEAKLQVDGLELQFSIRVGRC